MTRLPATLPTDRYGDRRAKKSKAPRVPRADGPVALDATIHVVHGRETVATTEHGFERAAEDFAVFIRGLERRVAA